jgi:hypothetical protein
MPSEVFPCLIKLSIQQVINFGITKLRMHSEWDRLESAVTLLSPSAAIRIDRSPIKTRYREELEYWLCRVGPQLERQLVSSCTQVCPQFPVGLAEQSSHTDKMGRKLSPKVSCRNPQEGTQLLVDYLLRDCQSTYRGKGPPPPRNCKKTKKGYAGLQMPRSADDKTVDKQSQYSLSPHHHHQVF